MTLATVEAVEELEPIRRLSRDLLDAARELSHAEVRYIVDGYYQIQEYRKAAANQVRAAQKAGEPARLLLWLRDQAAIIEGQIKRAMQEWAESRRVGCWCLSQVGVGPVLTAGLLAHIDIEKAPTVGKIWRFAGLDPTLRWEKGQKRPYNADLKVLCWRLGDSFVKHSGRPECYYGHAYRRRKEVELERNEQGMFREQAEEALENWRRGRRRKMSQHERSYYEAGKLPPGRIDLRARRWAVKLFLAHLHHVLWEDRYGEPPPKPYVIDRLGHTSYLGPPGWPM